MPAGRSSCILLGFALALTKLTSPFHGLLRTACSHNPKTFGFRPVGLRPHVLAGLKYMLFYASIKKHILLTLGIIIL